MLFRFKVYAVADKALVVFLNHFALFAGKVALTQHFYTLKEVAVHPYTVFEAAAQRVTIPADVRVEDAFLAWLSAYTIDDLRSMTNEQLTASLKTNAIDLDADVTVATENPPAGKSMLSRIYDAMFLPTHLYAAFIHEYSPDQSNWVKAHEAGRLFAEKALGDKVQTRAYIADAEHSVDALFDQAVQDGAQAAGARRLRTRM